MSERKFSCPGSDIPTAAEMAARLRHIACDGYGWPALSCLNYPAHVVTGRPETSFDSSGEEMDAICTTLAVLLEGGCHE